MMLKTDPNADIAEYLPSVVDHDRKAAHALLQAVEEARGSDFMPGYPVIDGIRARADELLAKMRRVNRRTT